MAAWRCNDSRETVTSKSKIVPLFTVRDLGATSLDQETSEVHGASPSLPSEGSYTPFLELSSPVQRGIVLRGCIALLLSKGPVHPSSSGEILQ